MFFFRANTIDFTRTPVLIDARRPEWERSVGSWCLWLAPSGVVRYSYIMVRKKDISQQIAERLRNARGAAGLSQAQASRLLKISRPAISQIESGKRKVSADELVRLAGVYGVRVAWVVGEEEPDLDASVIRAARNMHGASDEDRRRLMRLVEMLALGNGGEE